ncbi:MAG: DEAD/DEAH box helicase family protein [Chloroflexi bacterium]|nr:DEAD/DEAH box helicase family protein [Chloroflexota bacterium]
MTAAGIDKLIINSPYAEPARYWSYSRDTRTFALKDGRRPAGYVVATPGSKAFDDPGIFYELPLVNRIRPRVKAWREAGYPGVTGITQRLLEHWRDAEQREGRRFFFCQLEAVETLIWLAEAPAADRVGVDVPGDGGPFQRVCAKMATGAGKTIVMAMLVAWHILNKVTYPQDRRFSKHVLVIAPGLTVRSRLQVLLPSGEGNYYDEFNIVPPGLADRLRQGRVLVRNWHALNWETDEQVARKRSVDKRGARSDEAYVRDVLGELAGARNLLVINDEAHHAWRVPAESKVRGVSKEDLEQATRWIGGLDRIHRARGLLACYDLSATPFAPSGKASSEEALFSWIASDFGLNDAIESGLVKTPRVVVRDDGTPTARTYRSRLYHLYMDAEVKDDLNRKAQETESLPDLVINGYYLLGKDWLETARGWQEHQAPTPPAMITVANRTETAARVKYAFDHGRILIDELCAPEYTLHIDSRALEQAEAKEEPLPLDGAAEPAEEGDAEEVTAPRLTAQQHAELLRRMVDTIGQVGKPGERIQNVISVGMLSEGWDARTVTHIMGLRAFSSQLLCEQVVGRGLRRTSYEVDPASGLFGAEYVNVFGVPFTFLPHEGGDGAPPPPPSPKTKIEPVAEKRRYALSWPNLLRVEHTYRARLTLDVARVKPLALDANDAATRAELAAVVEGKPDLTHLSQIDLEELGRRFRLQHLIFRAAANVFDEMRPAWKGSREYLLAQLIGLVERFVGSDRVTISPPLFVQDDLRRRILLALNMNRIVQHLWEAIRFENTEALEPVFDAAHPVRSTADVQPWYTGRPCELTQRSHLNFCVFDSTWEASEACELDHNPNVDAWVKNDHLGFEVLYVFKGVRKKYRPDFLIRLTSGRLLVLEVKGQDSQEDRSKREFLAEWVRAVNAHGGFGHWRCAVSRDPKDVGAILRQANEP